MSSKSQIYKPTLTRSNLFTFDYDVSSNFTKTLYRDGVEAGCQAFIVSDDVLLNFLKDFHDVHDDCIQVFPNKHIVVYQSGIDDNFHESIDGWERSAAVDGKVLLFNLK